MEAKAVFDIFAEINKVPRPSKHEEKICEWLIQFAKEHQLEYEYMPIAEGATTGNILMRKPATLGYEDHPTVVLQAHMDMVCEKNADCPINFETDPIETYIEDGWLHAKGTTLGADDGIGMAMMLAILTDEEAAHPALEALFTTDEEIGLDAKHISREIVTSEYGYTIDGGDYRFVSIESFSAYSMEVEVKGRSIHPGYSKDKMVNASNVLIRFHQALPEFLRPEHTDQKEPFYHLSNIQSCEDHAKGDYIIRSFEDAQALQLIELAKLTARRINDDIGYEAITLHFENQYHNMKVELDKHPEIQKEYEGVYAKLGIPFMYEAIRGGTTGSQLSFMGLPTPNLGTGDYNMHGRYEYVDLDQMKVMVSVVRELMLA